MIIKCKFEKNMVTITIQQQYKTNFQHIFFPQICHKKLPCGGVLPHFKLCTCFTYFATNSWSQKLGIDLSSASVKLISVKIPGAGDIPAVLNIGTLNVRFILSYLQLYCGVLTV